MRPEFTVDNAETIVRVLYGISGSVEPLPSYSDQNFLVDRGDVKFVFKIANSSEPRAVLDFQQQALEHVHANAPALRLPHVIPASDGSTLNAVPAPDTGETHFVWMVNFIPGRFISDLPAHPPFLLEELGAFLGRLDRTLASFEHPAMHRDLPWDLRNAPRLVDLVDNIKDSESRSLVRHFLGRFEVNVRPLESELRTSVIHNDANDNNVLIDETTERPAIGGIIDFGDMLHSYTVAEVAIVCAYMILGKENPVEPASRVLKGYHAHYPLTEIEIAVLFDLICMRLCTSVCMSARERSLDPDNAYLAVSEQPAWDALALLIREDPGAATDRFGDCLN